ncbi:MAG: amino acid--tRNA ligase-related protein [bacterium]
MRHLSIVNGQFAQTTRVRSEMLRAARKWFDQNSFTEVNVPHITGATGSCEWFPNAMEVCMFNEQGTETPMFLRQTGQLYLEAFTMAHNRVYTIGPSFRQERKVTDRHLCEFTLIELESRDVELDGLMDYIEAVIKAMYTAAATCMAGDALGDYISKDFNRIRYADAITLLRRNGHAVESGDDFGSDEELAICELLGSLPTFVTHYPSDPRPKEGGVIKFFSMKRAGAETLCCDLLLPHVGESVGGAVREGSGELCKRQFEESYMYDHLTERGVSPEQFAWYFETLDLKPGQSSGCGIGFDRVVQSVLVTRETKRRLSIKQAVEIPRSPEFLMV